MNEWIACLRSAFAPGRAGPCVAMLFLHLIKKNVLMHFTVVI